jgi:PrtD family type I secretion system ABC transporter
MHNPTLLGQFFASVRRGLLLIAGISLAANLLMLALPIYSLQVFDRVLLSRSLDTMWVLTLGVTLVVVTVALLEWLRGQLVLRLSNRLALSFERNLFDEILLQATRMNDRSLQPLRDLSMLRNFISAPQGLIALIDAPLVPIFLLVVYLMHPWLGVVTTVGMITLFAMAWIADKTSAPLSKTAFAQAQSAQRRLADLAQGSDVLAAHGMNRRAYEYWQNMQHPSMVSASHAGAHTSDFASVAKGVRLILSVSLTAVGGYLAMTDQITVGAMIAANILGSRGLAPIEVLIGASRQMIGVRLSWQRLEKLLNVQAAPAMTRLPSPRGAVDVERVVYAPPGSTRTTIKGISFRLEPGTFLGLVGPSAAGKSTLGRLLCGVWVAQSGIIRLDGADLQIWDREDFGRSCGYLPQDVQLFDGTVRENISRLGEASDEDVIAAAMAAGAHEFIVKLPQGYETPAGVGGAALSAGQRQRIGLARALFGNPQLVVLDEPNANLDSEGEEALALSLARLKARGATAIVISHRPTVLAVADMLAVLVEGQLQQFGPRPEVLKRIQAPRPVADQHVA